MRQIDDQLSEILRRTDIIREKTKLKKQMLTEAAVSVICFAFIALSLFNMPEPGSAAGDETRYGSLILSSQYIGYIVIGALAFIIGVCVTLLCIQWKKYNSCKK